MTREEQKHLDRMRQMDPIHWKQSHISLDWFLISITALSLICLALYVAHHTFHIPLTTN